MKIKNSSNHNISVHQGINISDDVIFNGIGQDFVIPKGKIMDVGYNISSENKDQIKTDVYIFDMDTISKYRSLKISKDIVGKSFIKKYTFFNDFLIRNEKRNRVKYGDKRVLTINVK